MVMHNHNMISALGSGSWLNVWLYIIVLLCMQIACIHCKHSFLMTFSKWCKYRLSCILNQVNFEVTVALAGIVYYMRNSSSDYVMREGSKLHQLEYQDLKLQSCQLVMLIFFRCIGGAVSSAKPSFVFFVRAVYKSSVMFWRICVPSC